MIFDGDQSVRAGPFCGAVRVSALSVVMAITKRRIGNAGSEPLHTATRCRAPVWPHQRRMVRVAWMEKRQQHRL